MFYADRGRVLACAGRSGATADLAEAVNRLILTGERMHQVVALRELRRAAAALTRRGAMDELRSGRSEEHTSELQSLMRISYAVFCLKIKMVLIKMMTLHGTHARKTI